MASAARHTNGVRHAAGPRATGHRPWKDAAMADRWELRMARILISDGSGRSILLDDSGELPSFRIRVIDDETTIQATSRVVLPMLGLDRPVIECLVDQEFARDASPDDAIPALIELPAPPPEWPVPDGLEWVAVVDAKPTIEPGLAAHLTRLLDERRGVRPVAELRARWSCAGWYERAKTWIERVLADAGRPPPIAVEQVRHWGISAVMRVDTASGPYWFKAVFPHFRNEPAITAFLDREIPGSVAPVIAIDVDEGWLLLGDVGPETLASNPFAHRPAIEHLVAMQRRYSGRTDELAAAGFPRRSLGTLPSLLGAALAAPTNRPWLDLTPDRISQLIDWLTTAVAEIDALGVPDTLVHGDFHPGNIAIRHGRPVLFDWSDAAISNPLVDVVTWASWFPDDVERVDELWTMFFDAWADVIPINRSAEFRPTLEAVAGAYHTISYAGILAELEPSRRPEHAGGLTDFLGLLDAAVPATAI